MKGLFYALVLCMAFETASAQIQMKETQSYETICSASNGWDKLEIYKANGTTYYLLSLASENRFDSLYLIDLGTKENAIATLTQLLETYSPGKQLNCLDDRKEPFFATAVNSMGDKYWSINKKGFAGNALLRLYVIRKFLKSLQEE